MPGTALGARITKKKDAAPAFKDLKLAMTSQVGKNGHM